jgi:phosphatidylethanolamine-binding protein (PEBP) family uncharacterized protein
MPISNQRDYLLKTKYSHHTTVGLTQAVANAATADYSVADLVNLVNVALTTRYNNVTTRTIGQATSTLATETPASVPLALALTSTDFNEGAVLPDNVGAKAASANDLTNPQLGWVLTGDDAANVVEYRLSSVDTSNSNYVHWNVTGIVNTTLAIAATSTTATSNWAGTPTIGTTGGGVGAAIANGWEFCNPPSATTHTYTFTVTGHSSDGTVLVTSNVLSGTYTGA